MEANGKPQSVSYPLFQYFRDNLKSIQGAAAEMVSNPTILIDGADEVVSAELVSGSQYSVLGVEPAAGRLLQPADDVVAPASPAAVISYGYWQRRFGLNPTAIGKTFRLPVEGKVFTIVGVTPPRYHGARAGGDPDITLPLTMMLGDELSSEPTDNMLNMMGRLAPGVTREQANAELQVLWQTFVHRIAATLPAKVRPRFLQQRAAVLSGAGGFDPLRDEYAPALLLLMGIVALVLLLACANLSGLLLARAASREREISIRLAIGAGRGRLMRQFLTESFLLAMLGGISGLLMARWFISALVAMMSNGETLALSTAPDWRVLVFTTVVSVAACLLAGLAPGLHAVRANLNAGLRQSRMGGQSRMGKALVVAQLAISMVLATGAALSADTLLKLYSVDTGLRTDGILALSLRTSGQCPAARCRAAVDGLLNRLNGAPGVASASAVDVLPLSGSLWDRSVQVEGYTFRPDESEVVAFDAIAPRYFATVGTPLLSGREFDAGDTSTSKKVAIVNERFARYFSGGGSLLGRRVASTNTKYEIVGVVKGRTSSKRCTSPGPSTQAKTHFLVRVKGGNPTQLVPVRQELVREADPALHLRTPQPYSTIVSGTIVTERIMAALGGFFGLLALIVACLGIFGVMAFQVSRRINEIGVRMALEASQIGIVTLVLREVTGMLAAGWLIGTAAGLSLTGLTRAMLFGVSPAEPAVFALAGAAPGLAALGAGSLPARRAARVDPMVALRHE